MPNQYSFDSRLIIRTPLLPMPLKGQPIDTDALIRNDQFMEALYLASSVLYEECIKWRKGLITTKKDIDKLMVSVSKYYLRMSSRCTPFGLFSGCAVTHWNDACTAVSINSKQTERHTRLDMQYLCALAQNLSARPAFRKKLLFFPNSSLYRMGRELRYVEYTYIDGLRHYQISSVVANDYLEQITVLAAQGAKTQQLTDFLTADEIPLQEAGEYIEKLINSQLLTSELEPSITGKEYMEQLVTILKTISKDEPEIQFVLDTLYIVDELLIRLDQGLHRDITHYKTIMQQLDGLGVAYNEGKLFQTDVVNSLQPGGVNNAVQLQITEALQVLNSLSLSKGNDPLVNFAMRFSQRYGDKEMPLLEVMDTETGIGYMESTGSGICPLVCDLQISGVAAEQKLGWSKMEMMLNEKLKEINATKKGLLQLTDKDVAGLVPPPGQLPASLPVVFRSIDEQTIYLENAGGSSAVNLLGRFAHADPAVHSLALSVTQQEQEQNPSVVYAEIIHLPEARTGNILLHPAFRKYEIPYLAQSSLDKEFQLALQDLYITVTNNEVVLRSKRLNKIIAPRLSTAHNYSLSSLPVYRFLCDLQGQGKKVGLTFSWGSLRRQHSALPRVMYKHVILSPASWNFSSLDLECLKNNDGDTLTNKLLAFRSKWQLPADIIICEGDNELPLDLDNPCMVNLFTEMIKNKETLLIKEFIRPAALVIDENNAMYANQFIAVLNSSVQLPVHEFKPARQLQHTIQQQRIFTLGSEWLYCKLYCGIKSADRILTEAIAPAIEELNQYGLIDKWFFIRYHDPEFHLRVRFHLKDKRSIGDVILLIHTHLQPFEQDGYIWKLQTDTYTRELERYGQLATELAESIFYHDSEACLQMLEQTNEADRSSIRWMWALPAVDHLLDSFDLSDESKLTFMEKLRDNFAAEFKSGKILKTQLNDKYRTNKQAIEAIMNNNGEHAPHWYPLMAALKKRSDAIRPIAEKISTLYADGSMEVSLYGLLGSYIHMMINRIVTSEARMHELVIYDFLCRCYKARSYFQSSALCNKF